jgi:hypothetical protein
MGDARGSGLKYFYSTFIINGKKYDGNLTEQEIKNIMKNILNIINNKVYSNIYYTWEEI